MASRQSAKRAAGNGTRRGRSGSSARSVRGRRPEQARSRTASGPSRRRALRRRWVAVLGLVCVLGLAYVLLFSSLFGVGSVRVVGTQTAAEQRVRAVASVPTGEPLARVDTDAIRARVAKLAVFSSVDVSRSWPSTIVISVTEREPVAVLETGSGYRLVDAKGVVFDTSGSSDGKPPALPRLSLENGDWDAPRRRAAVSVLAAIPERLRARVDTVSASTPNDVRLSLADGSTVVWGSAEQSARKARVLAALMTRPGSVYDVSSPALPTVS